MTTPNEAAATRYQNAKTRGMITKFVPEALCNDFVKFVNAWAPRSPPDTNLSGFSDRSRQNYNELLTTTFAPVYEAGFPSRGPSFQLLEIRHNIDLGRQADGSGVVDWGGITNQYEITMYFAPSDKYTIALINASTESHGPDNLKFIDQEGIESVSFTRETSPSGIPCWHLEHSMGKKVWNNLHLTAVTL
jgi:hypothetical protein